METSNSTAHTLQNQYITGRESDQVKNSAGGFVFQSGHGVQVLNELVAVSLDGRAAKQGTTIFVLALCLRLGDDETRKQAYKAIPDVCRIPISLFQLLTFTSTLTNMKKEEIKKAAKDTKEIKGMPVTATTTTTPVSETEAEAAAMSTTSDKKKKKSRILRQSPPNNGRGWGRGMCNALATWYNNKSPLHRHQIQEPQRMVSSRLVKVGSHYTVYCGQSFGVSVLELWGGVYDGRDGEIGGKGKVGNGCREGVEGN
jgi:hypothetical protein